MSVGAITVNEGTQSNVLTDTAGTQEIGVVKIDTSAAGTYGSLWSGNVGISSGTINSLPNIPAGTITRVSTIGTLELGTVTLTNPTGTTVQFNNGTVDLLKAGTITKLEGGTVQTNILTGTITRVSTIGTLEVGTISSLPNLPQGSINVTAGTVSAGTINTGTVNTGTINVATVTAGSIRVTVGTINAGTVGGAAATAVALSGNPVPVAGVDSGGTIYGLLVDAKGQPILGGGTVDMLKAGTISTLPNIPGGTITRVSTIGTLEVGTISSLPNLPQGSINVTAGTITAGTVGGKAATGAASSGNPVFTGGTDPGGTVYGLRVDTAGVLQINGTVSTGGAGTQAVRLIDGTLTVGTVGGKAASGAAAVANPVLIAGTDSGGTVYAPLVDNTGAVKVTGASAGTFVNLTTGTLNVGTINTGTINTGTINVGTFVMPSGTLTVLPNLPQGSINVTAGTVSAGTVNVATVTAGTINVGTITVGTVYKGVGAAAAGSLTAAGTITVAGSQLDAIYWDVGGTWVGTAFFEAQVGTSAYFAVPVITPLGAMSTATTGNGDFLMSAAGIDNARLRVTYSSGTLTHNERASNFFSPLHYAMGGSIGNVGMLNAGTISTLPNLPGGSIAVTAGTVIQTIGTVNTGTVNVATVTAGTVNVATVTAGSIRVTVGTTGGAAASGAAASGNPNIVAGTDSGGTVYGFLVDTKGQQILGGGTVDTLTTVSNLTNGSVRITVGTITVLPNLPQGSINVTAGTVSAGTINVGTITAGTINTGTINAGTITNLLKAEDAGHSSGDSGVMALAVRNDNGTALATTDLDYIPLQTDANGALRISGTISSIASGTTIGTISVGTVNTGTVNVATVTAGTVNVATVTAGTINIGTFKNDGRTARNILSYGTTFAVTSGSAWATLVGSASVGAGTSLWVNDVSVNNPAGSASIIVGFGTELTAGTNVVLKGTYGTQGAVGHQKTFSLPVNCGMTNKDLTLYVGVPGTVDVNVTYFISA